MASDACNRYRLTSPLRPRRHSGRTTAAPFSSLFSPSIRVSPFLSYSPNAFLCFALKFSQDFLSSLRPPPSSHSRFPTPSPSSSLPAERPRESLSSLRTLLPTVLPHSQRRYRFLSSSSALLLSHPSQPREFVVLGGAHFFLVNPRFVCSPLRDTDHARGEEERRRSGDDGARYARDTGGEWRKREADKGSVLQSEASEIFYELNCAGGLSAACGNRCPKISRPTVVTDICPSIFRFLLPHNFPPIIFTFTLSLFLLFLFRYCAEGNGDYRVDFGSREKRQRKIRRCINI